MKKEIRDLYVYESHVDNLYLSEKEIEDTHCDICGDGDTFYYYIEDIKDPDCIDGLLYQMFEDGYTDYIFEFFEEEMTRYIGEESVKYHLDNFIDKVISVYDYLEDKGVIKEFMEE